ncbi:MAG: YggT family protein [Firmicutes bacterium]|nr:YggT family protein [Bacillota bacterium]
MIPGVIGTIIDLLFRVVYILLLARIVFSWFPGARGFIVEALYAVTEPILAPIRNFLRRFQSDGSMLAMIDLSPLVAFLLLRILHSIIFGFLM